MNLPLNKNQNQEMAIRICLKEPIQMGLNPKDDLLATIDRHLERCDISEEERTALARIKQRIVIEFII